LQITTEWESAAIQAFELPLFFMRVDPHRRLLSKMNPSDVMPSVGSGTTAPSESAGAAADSVKP
jgi:hypothetical protein